MSVVKQFLIALDQALNTLVKLSDGWGYADEMLSARAWRLREHHPYLMKFIEGLFFWDDNHCFECYLIEVERKQLPTEYRHG
jgi:hypothetical protein